MRHTISIIIANEAGELSRVIGLFSARGYNIETMSVGKTTDPKWSKAILVTNGDETKVEQIVKQCLRLARVRDVKVINSLPHIEREMALVDVSVRSGDERQEVMNLVEIFRAKVVDISHEKMILEASGTRDKVDTFINMLEPLVINEITRTGSVAISRLSPLNAEGKVEKAAA